MRFVWVRAIALVAVIGGIWLLMPGAVRKGLPYQDAASVARGKSIYAESCASCHGAALEGQDNWRQRKPDGKMPAPPHDKTGHTWHHADDILIAITKYGTEQIVGQGYKSDMPGFGDVLSDQDILDVLGYIKSTWPDRVIDMHNKANGA
ncbi:MAG: c-type cytochrome [Shimia sp.]|uniref:c-type cytochrome n=1 Tax=Shimia sp. TaxID=1954381 RepID=UPI0040592F44